MKLTKKLTTLFLTLALVIGTSVTAFAAPSDDVITALKNANVPATYIIQAENYLKTTTITEAEATAVIAEITKANAVLDEADTKDLADLSQADKTEIIGYITAAGNAIDLTVTVAKQSNGQYAIVAKDEAGNLVVNFASNEVKQTGMDNTIIYAGMLLIILAAGSVFVLRRNTLKANS